MDREELWEPIGTFVIVLVLLGLLVLQPGCGGGTAGTGGRRFQGTVMRSDGTPVTNARVEIPSTGEGASTDSAGNFSFESEITPGNVAVRIVEGAQEDSIIVTSIPEDATEINLDLIFESSAPEAQILSADIEIIQPEPPPEPTPTPEGVSCGAVICEQGMICCNEGCGLCSPPGGVCPAIICPGVIGTSSPTPMPSSSPPAGVSCGRNTCSSGEVCCNSSCGICTPPDGACIQLFCE